MASSAHPLLDAIQQVDTSAVKSILDSDLTTMDELNEMEQTPLHVACAAAPGSSEGREQMLSIVQLLLRRGADVNARDFRGWTPLHFAAHAGLWTITEFLLDVEGINLNSSTESAMTPVFFFICHQVDRDDDSADHYLRLLRRLHELDADFQRKSITGDALLHFAALYCNLPAADFLLTQLEVCANVTNSNDETPLFFAVSRGSEDMVKLLLEYDANPLWMSKSGQNAYQRAVEVNIDMTLLQEVKAAASAGVKPTWIKRLDNLHDMSGPSSSLQSGLVTGFRELLQASEDFQMADLESKKGRKLATQQVRDIESLVGRIVAAQYGTSDVTAEDVSWAFLFNKRMMQGMNVLSMTQATVIITALSLYKAVQLKAGDKICPLVDGLRCYLVSHGQDPDNSLIGLRPAWDLLAELEADLIQLALALDGCGGREMFQDDSSAQRQTPGTPIKSGSKILFERSACQPELSQPRAYTRGFPALRKSSLCDAILASGLIKTDAGVKEHVSRLTVIVEHEKILRNIWAGRTIEPYELVICVTKEPEGYRYAYLRYTGHSPVPNVISVFTIPGEMMTRDVHISQVLPLTPKMKACLGKVKKMSSMVDGAARQMKRALNIYLREEQNRFLRARGVDVDLLEQLGCISASHSLKHLKEQLETLLANFDEEFAEFFSAIRVHLVHRSAEMRASYCSIDTVFYPTKDLEFQDVLSMPIEVIVKTRLRRHVSSCQAMLGNREKMQREKSGGGNWKNMLTEWWTDLIETEANSYLERLGFVAEGLSVGTASDLPRLKQNSILLGEILDRGTDKHSVEDLIAALKRKIYPQIEDYMAMARFMVQDALGMSTDRNSAEFKLLLSSKSHRTDTRSMEYVLGLSRDLAFLDTVRSLEGMEDEERCAETSKTIVPISGLIMGTFARYQAETKKAILQLEAGRDRRQTSPMPLALPLYSKPESLPDPKLPLPPIGGKAPNVPKLPVAESLPKHSDQPDSTPSTPKSPPALPEMPPSLPAMPVLSTSAPKSSSVGPTKRNRRSVTNIGSSRNSPRWTAARDHSHSKTEQDRKAPSLGAVRSPTRVSPRAPATVAAKTKWQPSRPSDAKAPPS